MEVVMLQGFFDTNNLANLGGTGLLQKQNDVFWEHDGIKVDLRDAKKLIELMECYKSHGKYPEVKFINQILSQIDFTAKKTVVWHYPEMLQIEHTDICNARCIMCNHSFTRNHGCQYIDMAVIHRLEPYLPYVRYIALNGIGEPLLHPNIMELMQIYEKYGIKLTTNTNLSIMTPELATIMHRTFQDIQISCDACDKETYENIRQGLSFDKFVKNAHMLREAGNVEICMATVVMRQNITQLPEIVKFASQLGCNKLVMLDLNTSNLLENTNDSIRNFPRTASYYMEKARETAEKYGIYIHVLDYVNSITGSLKEETDCIQKTPLYPEPELYERLYSIYEKIGFEVPLYDAIETDYCCASRFNSNGYCQFIENRPFISSHGDVFNCCTRRMHTMGNILNMDFENIWNGKALQAIRKIMNSGTLPKYCVGCTYLSSNLMVDRIQIENMDDSFYSEVYDTLRMRYIRRKLGDKPNGIM